MHNAIFQRNPDCLRIHEPLARLGILFLLFIASGTLAAAELSPDQIRDLDSAIANHRQGKLIIKTTPGAEVVVTQLRHEFWFGAALSSGAFNGSMRAEDRERYLAAFLTNFNAAVTENALKWHAMEQQRGKVDYATVDAILAWTDKNQIPLRGHNIFWGIPNRVQEWLKVMSDEELRETLKQRALDIGKRYRGRFAEYDLNNEMVHGNYYEERLGTNITLQMAQWVRQEDPQAVLFLNDYDMLTGRRVKDYVRQIQSLQSQGTPIGGIGVQGHSHADTFDPQAVMNSLQELSQFHLPIRITEFNMPGQNSRQYRERGYQMTEADEAAKAKALTDYYRICFAQPAVEGILMWGYWEGANWIPASSLYKRDWTPLPAAKAYHDLVYGQWWTHYQGRADAQGRCEVQAFFGKHRIQVGTNEAVVEFSRKQGSKNISIP
jgi:GH35 family endo-1,4-beta-xylanase